MFGIGAVIIGALVCASIVLDALTPTAEDDPYRGTW